MTKAKYDINLYCENELICTTDCEYIEAETPEIALMKFADQCLTVADEMTSREEVADMTFCASQLIRAVLQCKYTFDLFHDTNLDEMIVEINVSCPIE